MEKELKEFKKIILNFDKQLFFYPKINFFKKIDLNSFKKIVLIGMGGSHLAMDLIKILPLKREVKIYSNYQILKNDLKKENLFILSSYSGDTEEVIDVFFKLKNKFPLLIISKNGELLKLAKKYKINFIQLPQENIMPRYALGYFFKTFLYLIDKRIFNLFKKKSFRINYFNLKKRAEKIAEKINDNIIIIFTNFENLPLALHFKIKLNETAKWPAFINFLPEANHNEVISFTNNIFKHKFLIVFLEDKYDYSKNLKNFRILQILFKKEKIKFLRIKINEKDKIKKILNNIILVDWITYFLAKKNKISPLEINFIEKIKEFKKI